MTRSLPLFVLVVGSALAGRSPAQSPPVRAGYASMFNPTGPLLTTLDAGAPPVLGTYTSLTIQAPPQAVLGVLALSATAQVGLLLPLLHPIEYYLDLTGPLMTFHRLLPSQQTVMLPLPYDPSLVGVNVAFQAFAASTPTDLSASNLQFASLGLSPYSGTMQLQANPFGPVPIAGLHYMKTADGNDDKKVFTNFTAAPVSVTLTITVQPVGAGPLEIRDGNGGGASVIGWVPAGQSPMTVKVTVPAAATMYFYNGGGAAMTGVTWTIDSVR